MFERLATSAWPIAGASALLIAVCAAALRHRKAPSARARERAQRLLDAAADRQSIKWEK